MLIFRLLESPLVALTVIGSLVIGITIHEFSHALAGYLQGDMTARDAGRLTLNPLSHLDPMGSLMLVLVGFGWGKPTPYNPYNLRNAKWGPLMVALFGPLSNLVFVILSFAFIVVLAPQFGVESPTDIFQLLSGNGNLLMIFLLYLYLINVMLMVFNLLPLPPLDGAQILNTLLPSRYDNVKYFLAKNGPFLLFGLVVLNMFGQISIFERIIFFFISLVAQIFV